MKDLLSKLSNGAKLTRTEAKATLLKIGREEFTEAQIAAFITVYLMRPITAEELAGFQEALLELCVPLDLEGREAIDIVGTGGDGKNTFNISTLSSFVVAGAGYQVCKHGNYGVSSACGSSNVLQHLGYEFTNDQNILLQQLDTAGICFLHAPLFHPAMKVVAPIRRSLGVKTFFNMLGPLVNPAQPKFQLFGVYNSELTTLYKSILQAAGKRFTVVHALDGYDEISLTGPVQVCTQTSDQVLSPSDLGFRTYREKDLFGGTTVNEAADIFMAVLKNRGTQAQKDVVVANAGMAIHCIKEDQSLEDCFAEARESLESGSAHNSLHKTLKAVEIRKP